MADFKTFITSLLERSHIKLPNNYLDADSMKLFQRAFTHKSFDAVNNYEHLEFVGDAIVNNVVAQYLKKWDDELSVCYLTRLKHNITSKKQLAIIAENAGFFKHIRMSDELRQRFLAMDAKTRHIVPSRKSKKDVCYMDVLEDCMEAVTGAISEVVDRKSGCKIGVGFVASYTFISSFLDELEISTKYEDIFDAKSRFKEICDQFHWSFSNAMGSQLYEECGKKTYTVYATAFPYGDKRENEKNKCQIKQQGVDKDELEMKVAAEMIELLKRKFNIEKIPPNPHNPMN